MSDRPSKTGLTVLLGSGFAEGLGLPGTSQLTTAVRSLPGPQIFPERPNEGLVTVPGGMWRMATSYYSNPNFETMLHLVETAIGYQRVRGWLAADDSSKAAFGAFMNIMPHWERFIEQGSAYSFQDFYSYAINAIAKELVDATNENLKGIQEFLAPFLSHLKDRFQLTLATLNYDDTLERSLETWHDGFGPQNDRQAFNPPSLLSDRHEPLLMHLHGSVRFYTLAAPEEERVIYRADSADLKTPQVRGVFWQYFAQSGELLLAAPMISGLRKSDKVTTPPFGYYQYRFHDSLMKCPRLLVIGYGAGDTYLNSLLLEMRRIHESKFRAIFVTKCEVADVWNRGVTFPAVVMGADPKDAKDLKTKVEAAIKGNGWTEWESGLLYLRGFSSDVSVDELTAFFGG